jgi:hypothetical protein
MIRRIFNLVRLYFVQRKFKHNQDSSVTRKECLALLGLLNPVVLNNYIPGEWMDVRLNMLYPHLDSLNERITKFKYHVTRGEPIGNTAIPDYRLQVTFDEFMTSKDGYHTNIVAALTEFKHQASALCEQLQDVDIASTGEAAHHLRILAPILIDIRKLSLVIIKEGR